MVLTLRRELDKAGFQSTKIHMADAPYMYMALDRVRDLQQNPTAWQAIDFTAAHECRLSEVLHRPAEVKYDARYGRPPRRLPREALPGHRNLHQRRQAPGALLPHRPQRRPALPEEPHHPRRRSPHVLLAHPSTPSNPTSVAPAPSSSPTRPTATPRSPPASSSAFSEPTAATSSKACSASPPPQTTPIS